MIAGVFGALISIVCTYTFFRSSRVCKVLPAESAKAGSRFTNTGQRWRVRAFHQIHHDLATVSHAPPQLRSHTSCYVICTINKRATLRNTMNTYSIGTYDHHGTLQSTGVTSTSTGQHACPALTAGPASESSSEAHRNQRVAGVSRSYAPWPRRRRCKRKISG